MHIFLHILLPCKLNNILEYHPLSTVPNFTSITLHHRMLFSFMNSQSHLPCNARLISANDLNPNPPGCIRFFILSHATKGIYIKLTSISCQHSLELSKGTGNKWKDCSSTRQPPPEGCHDRVPCPHIFFFFLNNVLTSL